MMMNQSLSSTVFRSSTGVLSLILLIGHIGAFSPRSSSSSFNIIGSGSVSQKRVSFGNVYIKKYNQHHDDIRSLCMQRNNNNNDDDDNNNDESYAKSNNVSSRREWLMKLSSTSASASILTLRTQNVFAEEENTLTLESPTIPTSTSSTTTSLSSSSSSSSSSITQQSTTANILCDPSVSIFYNPDKKRTVYLLGTAHISSKSADAAAQIVRDIKPNAVFVELDAKRVGRAIPKPNPETWPMPPEKRQSQDESTLSSSSGGNSMNNDDNTEVVGDGNNTSNISSTVATTAVAAATTATTIPNVGQVVQEQPESQTVVKKQPKFFDFREMALRKGSEIVGNSIKGLYSKLEAEGFNAGEGMYLYEYF